MKCGGHFPPIHTFSDVLMIFAKYGFAIKCNRELDMKYDS